MAATRRKRRPKRSAAARRWSGLLGWTVLLLGSLGLVVWRQTRAVALEAELRSVRSQREVTEAERVDIERQIQQLSSRARITRMASQRLKMHVPADGEIVFLPAPAVTASTVSVDGR